MLPISDHKSKEPKGGERWWHGIVSLHSDRLQSDDVKMIDSIAMTVTGSDSAAGDLGVATVVGQ
jgi:hypothetical protein